MYRPPAEAQSVLIRVADGCPYNRCTFCAMYKGVPYRIHSHDEHIQSIIRAAQVWPRARRIFLADGDALALSMQTLRHILKALHQHFPCLARVTCYASALSLQQKAKGELKELRSMGLKTIYLGLESGSDTVLHLLHKNSTSADMIAGAKRATQAGITVSAIVMIGAGGQGHSTAHVQQTAQVLGAMRPRYLSCLRLVPIPNTSLARQITQGQFLPLSEYQSVKELADLLATLPSWPCIFRADHSSNILPLAGRLPKDIPTLLHDLQELLDSGYLQENGPGLYPASL